LKRCASLLFDIPLEDFENSNKDMVCRKWERTPRDCLKFLGTEVFQHQIETFIPGIRRRFWIDHLHKDIETALTREKNVVISDYRFKHEIDSLSEKFPNENIRVVHIIPNFEGFRMPQHIDETEQMRPYDHVLHNCTIDQMLKEVDTLLISLPQK
jgi:hypothetical protein